MWSQVSAVSYQPSDEVLGFVTCQYRHSRPVLTLKEAEAEAGEPHGEETACSCQCHPACLEKVISDLLELSATCSRPG